MLSYHLHLEHGFVIEREKANCPELRMVEVDVFEDMKNMALNSQDTSWREIYTKYLLNVIMSQTILTVLGGLWTGSKFTAVSVKSC